MPRIASTTPRTVTTPRRAEESRGDSSASSSSSLESANPFLSTFEAYNPLTMWTNMMSASMAMFSPLGYGAMRGPLGY